VFEEEPLPRKSVLWRHKKVTVLPHISANTDFDTASNIVDKNIKLFREKKTIPKFVDLKRGY
jgi:glyoxylate/hydroxypyruvate reductase A